MKPLKLRLNAFGPYSGYEEINFSKLDNIYLITGQTGAGKTTIFDGISFALFGRTSGSERDIKEIKSDFSDEGEVSYVELEFMLHNKIYKIRREPTQKIKGRKTKKEHNAELYLPNGKIISKITEIDGSKGKMQEILGLNVEQFRQIVMLPQGEFKKLIESSTDEKETIFRKIFSSKIYKDFQDNLKLKSSEARKDLEKYIDRRELLVKKINPGENEALKESIKSNNLNVNEILKETKYQIEKDESVYKLLQIEKGKFKDIIECLTNKIQTVKEVREKEKRLSIAKNEYNSLLAKESEYKSYKTKLENGIKAKDVLSYEKALIEADNLLKRREIEKNKAIENLNICEVEFNKKKEELKKEDVLNIEKESLKVRLLNLEELIDTFKEYESKKELFIYEKNTLKNLEENEILKISEKNKLEQEIQEIDAVLENFEKVNIELITINNDIKKKKDEIEYLRDFYKKVDGLKDNIKVHINLSNKYNLISEKYLKINENYNLISEEMKKQQAGILARTLKEGEPCIVCGSTHHPKKAMLLDKNLTDDKVNRIKEELENIKDEKETAFQKVIHLNSKIEEIINSVIKEGIKKVLDINDFNKEDIENVQNEIIQKGKLLGKELLSLEENLKKKKCELENLKEKKNSKEEKLKLKGNIENELKVIENNIKESYAKYILLEQNILDLEKKYTDIKSLKDLESLIDNIKNSIKKIDLEINNLVRQEKIASENLALARKNIENKEVEFKESLEFRNTKHREFLNILSKVKLTKDIYKESIISEEDIKVLEEKIKDYNDSVLRYKEEIKILTIDVENKEKINIDSLEKEKEENNNKLNVIEDEEKFLYARISNNIDILNSVEEISKNIGDKEENYKVISHISNLANGNNSKRVTFERYVLAHHFNEILKAANIRFRVMTNERYLLERKIEITDGRKGQGLDFNVYDNYTGKTRSIKSLSGGESFKASLSLALGLSDVIESNSGGVRIDAMFIDEGFGTLDPESLEKAIETILELSGEGKIIAIISHVPELKERIVSKIEVKKTKDGSRLNIVEE